MRFLTGSVIALSAAVLMTSCGAGGDNQGLEYAPNMYHSVAYEPYSQIVDEDAGRWLTSIDYPDGHAEFFNSNKLNPFQYEHAGGTRKYRKPQQARMASLPA